MKRFLSVILSFFFCVSLGLAQEDFDDVLMDYVWNGAIDSDTLRADDQRILVYSSDSMPSGRFKSPLKFTRGELNKIKDPRVRDAYWYALNDTTDRERYLKAHYAFNKMRDNWCFEAGGGVQSVSVLRLNGGFSIGPQIEFGFRKELHPYWAGRGTFFVSQYKHTLTNTHESTFCTNPGDYPAIMPEDGWTQHLKYSSFGLRADLMLNLLNLAAGREMIANPFEFYTYISFGGIYSARELGVRDGSCFVPFFGAGLEGYMNFTQRWAMYLNMAASWQSDDLEGYTTQNSTVRSAVSLGVAYKFSRVIHFQRLGYDESGLRQQLNDAYEEGDRLATYIQELHQDTIINMPADLIEAAFFQIDRIELAHSYVLNLGFYADLIKNCPKQKFLVLGFADLEVGSLKRNLWLREQRAKVVADVLIKTYGVNPEQLIVRGGDLNDELPFLRGDGHHRFNRCTVVCPVTKEYRHLIETTEFEDKGELMDGRVPSTIRKNY